MTHTTHPAPYPDPRRLLQLITTDTDHHDPWQLRAACRGHPNPDIFHPPRARSARGMKRSASEQRRRLIIAEAKTVCAYCPVTAECLAYGDQIGDYNAIWGGKTGRERGRKRDDT